MKDPASLVPEPVQPPFPEDPAAMTRRMFAGGAAYIHGSDAQWSEAHHKALRAMETFGGSFVRALAGAWHRADAENHARLLSVFRHYLDQYTEMSRGTPGAGEKSI